jgi:tetraacyldisaccharide 4'-kinase
MNLRVILLYPLTVIYTIITAFRNHLFNIEYSRSFNYDIMTINVGNLSVGGTGKTPMVEYLIQLLNEKYSLATLSRGYKRKSKGFLIASKASTVESLGDEPFQFHLKFGNEVVVAVGENRSLAIPRILMEHPETQTILLDDAYQHRTVTPDFNILLTRYSSPFYNDFVLPSGYLRETRSGANRADAIIVTKCPSGLSVESRQDIKSKIGKYSNGEVPIYFSAIKYGIPVAVSSKNKFSGRVILFAGLANINPLVEYVSNSFELFKVISFNDHHDYKTKDVEELVELAKANNTQLVTTEKDIVKIRSNKDFLSVKEVGLFYLPISVQFLFDEGVQFDSLVKEAIISKYEKEDRDDEEYEEDEYSDGTTN